MCCALHISGVVAAFCSHALKLVSMNPVASLGAVSIQCSSMPMRIARKEEYIFFYFYVYAELT